MSIFKFFTRRQSETLTDNFASVSGVQDIIDESFPYSEYVARINQIGTGNLTATILNSNTPNFLSGLTFGRNDLEDSQPAGDYPGEFYIQFAAPISRSKLYFHCDESGVVLPRHRVLLKYESTTKISLFTFLFSPDNSRWDLTDGLLLAENGVYITIRIYN